MLLGIITISKRKLTTYESSDVPRNHVVNNEVVVNVHAERTTTSEQTELGVITCSKRKLITSEKKLASTTMLGVDVTRNSCMTMSIQLQPEKVMMMKL